MQIAAEKYDRGRFRVLAVSGEVDVYSAPSLKGLLVDVIDSTSASRGQDGSETPTNGVVLDLSGVPFMDSAGLGVLVGAQRRAHGAGLALRLAGGSAQLHRLLAMTGLVKVLPPFADVAAATA
ncbi:STAS domain-containing protein [Streptomyces sp. NP160]|uniref:STAS domain-containing protein n=1 Tax=Streptomyces sp. NP160 TaxID=2586637 RepID=UPI00111BAFA5|nr:STAS domain-containing protein [Streptomyces sp. NP160]TNM58364.1 STAS domain-containing protein [Streptomyces sp. NP160]